MMKVRTERLTFLFDANCERKDTYRMSKVTDAVCGMATPFAKERGLFVWDVRLDKEGPNRFLRVFIDGEDKRVEIEDCEYVSRAIDPLLDEADFIADSYYLEVSSAGLGRHLVKQEHYERMNGKEVTVALFAAEDGEKEFVGVLSATTRDSVTVNLPQPRTFDMKKVRFVKLNDDLDLF